VVLAAYPELSKEWCARIDATVLQIQTSITAAATDLKNLVNSAIDTVKDVIIIAITIAEVGTVATIAALPDIMIGNWVGAAVKGLREALKSMLDPKEFERVWGMLEGIGEAFMKDPVGFASKALEALGKGFSQFVGKLLEHLKVGFLSWLTGKFSDLDIPAVWNFEGTFRFICSVLGLSYQTFRKSLVKALGKGGEAKVKQLEDTWDWIQGLMKVGLGYIADKMQVFLVDMLQIEVINRAKNWVIEEVITKGVAYIAGLFTPPSLLVEAAMTVYHIVQWWQDNAKLISQIGYAVLDSLSAIAQGDIGKAANTIETALELCIPALIDFCIKILGLDDLAKKVRGFITDIQKNVQDAIDKVVDTIVNLPIVRDLLKLIGVDETDKEDHDNWVIKSLAALQKDVDAYSGDLTLEAGQSIAKNAPKEKGWRDEQRIYGMFTSLSAVSIDNGKSTWEGLDAKEKGKSYNPSSVDNFEDAEFAFIGVASTAVKPIKRKKTANNGLAIGQMGAVFSQDGSLALHKTPEAKTTNVIDQIPDLTALWIEEERAGGWYQVAYGATGKGFVAKSYIRLANTFVADDKKVKTGRIAAGNTAVYLAQSIYCIAPDDKPKIHQYVNLFSLVNAQTFSSGMTGKWWDVTLKTGEIYWIPSASKAAALIAQYNIEQKEFWQDAATVVGDAIKKQVVAELEKWPDGKKVLAFLDSISGLWQMDFTTFVNTALSGASQGLENYQKNLPQHALSALFSLIGLDVDFGSSPPQLSTAQDWINLGLSSAGLNSAEGIKNKLISMLPADKQKDAKMLSSIASKANEIQQKGFVKYFEGELESFKSNFEGNCSGGSK
jgi:hypothetical protein